jgi:putative FmdB family regulatory protein
MPIYEYGCDDCQTTFEAWQRMSDPPVNTCERCGGGKVRRLISSTSFALKGSGWYATDYARKRGGESATSKSEKSDKAA